MSRPFKTGIDYFPMDVSIDDKIEILEAEHGITGFAIWVKLLQKIYANNYWIKWDNKTVIVFSNRVNVDKNEVIAIINTCLEWEIFDKNLLDTYQILTSRGIQKRFFEITKRRNRIEVISEYLLIEKPTTENIVIVNVDNNSVNVCKSTQSKVKESKGKEETNAQNFNLFWSVYPKKKSKGQAEKAFKKINPDLIQSIISAVERQKRSNDWIKENGKYIPYPATWINAKGWEDEDTQIIDNGREAAKRKAAKTAEKFGL